jgi:capsular exopolysaccharide synthesis family protein
MAVTDPQPSTAGRHAAARRPDLDLRGLVTLLQRYWRVAAATFAVVVVLAVASTWVSGPTYRASASVLLRTEQSAQLFPRTAAADSLTRSPAAELEYTRSDAFRDEAREAAGNAVDVEVRRPAGERSGLLGDDGSSALTFVAEAGDAEEAAATANAWADTYVASRQRLDVDETQELVALLTGERDDLQEERRLLLEPVAALDRVLALTTDSVAASRLLNQRLALEQSLAGALDPLEQELRDLNERIAALELDARVLEGEGALAFVSVRAEPPDGPVGGSLARNLLVGVVAGTVFALLAVAAVRYLFDRVTTAADVEGATRLPVLAQVPAHRAEDGAAVEVTSQPASPASEGYRSLLAALDAASRGAPVRRLLVTSPGLDDGALSAAVNLAALAGQDGTRVLVVGLDLRDPRLHVPFGLPNDVGVTSVLTAQATVDEAVREVDLAGSRVSVLPAGPATEDPVQLLRSPAAAALFDGGVGAFDLVIYVGAPLSRADSLIVARSVDAALLVVASGTHAADDVAAAAGQLAGTGTRTPGVVLTGVRRTWSPWSPSRH